MCEQYIMNPLDISFFFLKTFLERCPEITIEWDSSSKALFSERSPVSGLYLVSSILTFVYGKNKERKKAAVLLPAAICRSFRTFVWVRMREKCCEEVRKHTEVNRKVWRGNKGSRRRGGSGWEGKNEAHSGILLRIMIYTSRYFFSLQII